MSKLKLEYEILVSGIYPFEGVLEKGGFKIVKNTFDAERFNSLAKESVIYLSPFVGFCCYPDSTGMPVYLTLQKEEWIEIDYGETKEYDAAFTNHHVRALNVFDVVSDLEKTIVLEVNNDIKFPIKLVRAYDADGNLVTLLAHFMKLNVPSLLSKDQVQAFEVMKRQSNRLCSGFSYEQILKLADNNKYFKNALSLYHASFSVSDHQVGFILLVSSLETLLGLDTYAKPEKCDSCGQTKYLITATISENVSLILMDKDDIIKKRLKKLYGARSKYVHSGKEIVKQDEQELQEYVRKVLLMYWYVSTCKESFDHKAIIAEVQSTNYKNILMYQLFLTALDNTSFEEKCAKMTLDAFLQTLKNNK